VYVDDMLVKSLESKDHIADLEENLSNPKVVPNETQSQ